MDIQIIQTYYPTIYSCSLIRSVHFECRFSRAARHTCTCFVVDMKIPVQKLVDAVNSNMSSTDAAKRYHVSDRTIRSHRQNPDQKFGAGRPRYLDDDQEQHLVALYKLLPEYGFSVTADIATKLAGEYMRSIGLSSLPGRKWLRSFMKRNRQDIKWKKEEKMEKIRAQRFTEETRKSWFALLKSVLIRLDLMDKPSQIFNCDETGFSDKTERESSRDDCPYPPRASRQACHRYLQYPTRIREEWWERKATYHCIDCYQCCWSSHLTLHRLCRSKSDQHVV